MTIEHSGRARQDFGPSALGTSGAAHGSMLRLLALAMLLIVAAFDPAYSLADAGAPPEPSSEPEPEKVNGWFPVGDVFETLIADPKQEHSYVSIHDFDIEAFGEYTVGAVGYGADFGIYRWPDKENPNGTQVGIKGGVFSQFNLDSASLDLINTDYTIGLVVSKRRGPLSGRFRVYHQSTHLGDELLLSHAYNVGERLNYSYEALEALASYDYKRTRAYLGGEYRYHIEPSELKHAEAHGGVEYYHPNYICDPGLAVCRGRFIAGADIKSHEQHDWNWSASGKAGIEWGKTGSGHRRVRALIEGYDGQMPFGQFFNTRVHSFGFAVYLYY